MNVLKAWILISLATAGCAKFSDSTPGHPTVYRPETAPKDLSNMRMPDLLAEKYSSAAVECRLWTSVGASLVLSSNSPNDTQVLDLLRDSSVPQVLRLSGRSGEHSISVEITLTEIDRISDGTIEALDGSTYEYQNSPALKGTYVSSGSTLLPSGRVSFEDRGVIGLNENIPFAVVTQANSSAGSSTSEIDYVECALRTKANSLYEDQWKQIGQASHTDACVLYRDATDCLISK